MKKNYCITFTETHDTIAELFIRQWYWSEFEMNLKYAPFFKQGRERMRGSRDTCVSLDDNGEKDKSLGKETQIIVHEIILK